MNNTSQQWLDTAREEYLGRFVPEGGAAVRFVVSNYKLELQEVGDALKQIALDGRLLFVAVDAAATKIHMVDQLFNAIARQVDWDDLAYRFVARVFQDNGYELPSDRGEFNLRRIAEMNGREEKLLRRDCHTWLERLIFKDRQMSQEFSLAMIRLCLGQLDSGGATPFLSTAVKEWLRGELRLITSLKQAVIFQKVSRHNARHLILSFCHWIRLVGLKGIVLTLDISRYTTRAPGSDAEGLYYSVPATLDAYEVLRQFIDSTDELEAAFIVVFAPQDEFLNDQRRGLDRYDALKLRIWNEVRDRQRQNPLAPLIRLDHQAS